MTLTNNAWSQNDRPAAAPAASLPHKVGLIDMAHVFKNYKKFDALREELKVEISTSEDKAKAMQQELADLQAKMKSMMEGSPAYTKTEKEIVSKAADFESFRRSASRDFLKKESQIYLQVYNETSEAVKKYADFYKYTLVIRFNREELDTDNPQTLLQGMNRQVVYHHAEDDITIPVLDFLNKRYAPSAAPVNPPKQTQKPGNTKQN